MKVENVADAKVAIPQGGHLDASNRDEFRAAMDAVVASFGTKPVKIILDLSNIRFVDSSGLGVIMTILKNVRSSGGELVACEISKPVKILFDLVRLDRVMNVFNDRAAAAASFKSAPPAAGSSSAPAAAVAADSPKGGR